MRSNIIATRRKIFLLFSLITICSSTLLAQENTHWNGKRAAVSLTYDDALVAQLQNAVPLLDSLNLKATFYLTGNFEGFRNHTDAWAKVAEAGHELGNHTLFHPCIGGPDRPWVQPEYDLRTYTVTRMADEVRLTNTLLETLDGRSTRTLAYPCGNTTAGDSSYVESIKGDLLAARGVQGSIVQMGSIDLFNIDSYVISGQSSEELIGLVKKSMAQNGLVVFLFHGVGGGHDLNVSLPAHRKLLKFLKKHEQQLWIAPMVDIAEYVKEYQQR